MPIATCLYLSEPARKNWRGWNKGADSLKDIITLLVVREGKWTLQRKRTLRIMSHESRCANWWFTLRNQ